MAVTLSRDELAKMKASVLPPTHDSSKHDLIKRRKEMSEDKLKNWPNTLEALRKKKESYMKDKEDLLESERQQVDLQEAELRRESRLAAIKRANELLYEQTDKMKNLRSQQLYSDVLYSRIDQLKHKEDVKKGEVDKEAKYHQNILEVVAKGDAQDVEKAKKVANRMKQVEVSRREQLAEVRRKREQIAEEERQVGLRIKARAQEAVEEDQRAYEEKKILAHESNLKMIAANEKIKAEKEVIRAQEALAAEQREKEIEITEKRNLARKTLEKRRFEKKQVQRQKIIDAAVEALAAKSSNEETLQLKQELELREKEDKKFADKEAKRAQEWEDIVSSRTAMCRKRKEETRKERMEVSRLSELATKKALDAIQDEKNKEKKSREMTIMTKNMQLQQAMQTNRAKLNSKVKDLEEQRVLCELSSQDDDKFNQVARTKIIEYGQQGKNVIPLMRALEYAQPDLLPSIRNPGNNIKNRPKEDY